jgi:hypothetical protein
LKSKPFDFEPIEKISLIDKQEVFRFEKIEDILEDHLTFKTDKMAWKAFNLLKK